MRKFQIQRRASIGGWKPAVDLDHGNQTGGSDDEASTFLAATAEDAIEQYAEALRTYCSETEIEAEIAEVRAIQID